MIRLVATRSEGQLQRLERIGGELYAPKMAVCSSPKVINDEFANLGVFLPYTQKGDNKKGLGLGLSISRKGIEAHGGHVRVRDIPGKGCVFSVEVKRYASNVSATPFPVIRELKPIASS